MVVRTPNIAPFLIGLLRPVGIGDVAAWVSHVLERGLHGPAGFDLGLVAQLDRHLVVADRLPIAGVENHVTIEGTYAVGDVAVDEACAELVIGAARDHAGEDNAAVEKEVDVTAVGGAGRNPAEDADAAVGAAVHGSVDLLIDDSVDAAVAADPAGYAAAQGGSKQSPSVPNR